MTPTHCWHSSILVKVCTEAHISAQEKSNCFWIQRREKVSKQRKRGRGREREIPAVRGILAGSFQITHLICDTSYWFKHANDIPVVKLVTSQS